MEPFKFKYNRVRRSYSGGSGIDKIRESATLCDNEYPEDWIASTVPALSSVEESQEFGVSIIDNESELKFSDFLKQHAKDLLGCQHVERFGYNTGFLMKLLDSSIRLPVQAHPSSQKAVELFGSPYGKTEAWLILNTRVVNQESSFLYIGFNEKLDKGIFINESISGTLEQGLDMLHHVTVKPGDIFMIPGGLPHALGPGLTVIEIMEPSDWIVVSERNCGDIVIPDRRRFGGLSPEKAINMYDFTPISIDDLKCKCKLKPSMIDASLSNLIDREQIRYFGLQKLILDNFYTLINKDQCCRAGIVISGNVSINTNLKLSPGDTFFLPAVNEKYELCGNGEVIFALPPLPTEV